MTEILHPFLTKFRQILRGNIDQYFFEKECFRSSFYSDYPLTIRHFETGLFIEGRHYILPTKTTLIDRDWDWNLDTLWHVIPTKDAYDVLMSSPLGDSPFFRFELYYIWEIAFSVEYRTLDLLPIPNLLFLVTFSLVPMNLFLTIGASKWLV